MVKRLLLLLGFVLCGGASLCAQVAYQLEECKAVSSSVVKLTFTVYGKNKKTVDADAQYTAIRIALYEGCPDTAFRKPLLEEGEATSIQAHPDYFENLYNYRLGDFISTCYRLSDFKGADKQKGTRYEIHVKVLQLRKDLEKNNIRKRMGI